MLYERLAAVVSQLSTEISLWIVVVAPQLVIMPLPFILTSHPNVDDEDAIATSRFLATRVRPQLIGGILPILRRISPLLTKDHVVYDRSRQRHHIIVCRKTLLD